jgi:hypothetical protein
MLVGFRRGLHLNAVHHVAVDLNCEVDYVVFLAISFFVKGLDH